MDRESIQEDIDISAAYSLKQFLQQTLAIMFYGPSKANLFYPI